MTTSSSAHSSADIDYFLELRPRRSENRETARGSAVSPEKLMARVQRRRRLVRQRLLRFLWPMAFIAAVIVAAALILNHRDSALRTDAIAARSEFLCADVLRNYRESKKTWCAFVMHNDETLDQLQTSALLAIEAFQLAQTERTRAALAGAWSLLPWTDQQRQFDHNEVFSNLDFSHDGHYLAAGVGRGGTFVLDLEGDSIVARIPHGGLPASDKPPSQFESRNKNALDFSPTENILATAGPDNTVRLWNERGDEIRRFEHDSGVSAVRFDATGQRLVSSDEGGNLILWDSRSGKAVQHMHYTAALKAPVFSPRGTYLGAISDDGTAMIWRVKTGETVAHFDHITDWGRKHVDGIAFSPDERVSRNLGLRHAQLFSTASPMAANCGESMRAVWRGQYSLMMVLSLSIAVKTWVGGT